MFWRDSETARAAGPGASAAVALLSTMSLALLSGCLSMQTPEKFLMVVKGGLFADEIKAISPDEAKLWVREFSDMDQGDFEFWADALKNDFVENRGYTPLGENEVQDDADREGAELLFETTVQGVPHRYSITLFVLEGWLWNTIRVAEYAAPKEIFDKYLETVRESVRTVERIP
jgi:hypothetical protein